MNTVDHDDATESMTVNDPMMGALVDAMMAHPWRTRWELATDPDTPLDALEWFIRFDPEPLVSIAAIMNPLVQPEVLELAAKRVDDRYRLEALANCGRQTVMGVALLAQSGFRDVRIASVLNPSCPDWVATKLAVEDHDDGVRRAAAFHRGLAPTVLRTLMGDMSVPVRMAVCERSPQVPYWMLEQLAGDRHELVRAAANRALGLNPEV